MPVTPRPLTSVVLTALRRRRGWSEQELAEADGITADMVSLYESGKRTPSLEKLYRFAAHMGYKRELVAFVLFSLETAEPPSEGPRSPVDPSPAERQRIREVAVGVCLAQIALIESHSIKMVRARRATKARRRAVEVCRQVLTQPPEQWLHYVEKHDECQRWAVAERLAHESEGAAADNAGRALALAKAAVRAAELSPGDEVWLSRLVGYTWILLGNAQRVGGHFRDADHGLAHARKLFEAGAVADPGLLATWRLPDREASLRRHQERFREALKLHSEALEVAPREAAGRVLLNQAFTLEQMGAAERALATLQKAESLVDGKREPRSLFGIRFNRIASLCRLGRHAEGELLLQEVGDLALKMGHELDLCRVLWLRGRIASGLGREEEAVEALEQVRRTFLDHKIPYDFAEVSLELAVVYRGQGRTSDVKDLTRQLLWIFAEQGVHGEAKKALRIFCEAAEKERLTEELIRRLLNYLGRAKHNPRLRFEL